MQNSYDIEKQYNLTYGFTSSIKFHYIFAVIYLHVSAASRRRCLLLWRGDRSKARGNTRSDYSVLQRSAVAPRTQTTFAWPKYEFRRLLTECEASAGQVWRGRTPKLVGTLPMNTCIEIPGQNNERWVTAAVEAFFLRRTVAWLVTCDSVDKLTVWKWLWCCRLCW